MNTTNVSALPEVRALPTLDRDALEQKARAWVADWKASHLDPVNDVTERLRIVADLFNREDAAREAAYVKCDAAVWTLKHHYHLAYGANLAGAIGTNRTGLVKVMRRAGNGPKQPTPDADKVLPKLAREAFTHRVRTDELRVLRLAALQQYLDARAGSNADAARIMACDPSLVSRLRHKESAA